MATRPPSADRPSGAWFAAWTRSRCEHKVHEGLQRKGVEAFLPAVRHASRRHDRRKVLERPLFPGYVFLRFQPAPDAYLRAAATDGLVRILGDRWDCLHPIPDEEINAVRRVVSTCEHAGPVPWLRRGERVRITAGALQGLEGLVEDWRGNRARFVVSIELLQRSVAVEVASALLERI